MRPNKLTMEGFTSFRQRTEIDFSELDLFAISGPTGSGKTSIIDAITFALYGQTARLGGKGLGELITQGVPRLSVMLEFQSGGKHYRIARVLKRSGPSSVRLNVVEGDGDYAFDGGAREISTQISKIVGLDFEAFTKAVLLPQGRFDEFLRGDSAERRKILEVLLNLGMYREMMQRANMRYKEKQTERDLIDNQLQREYSDATADNRQGLGDEIEKLNQEAVALNAQLMRLDELRMPAIELRQKRRVAVGSQSECDEAEEKIANEQRTEKRLAGELERQEKNFQHLTQELQQVPYDEDIHQKLIALRPIAQQLEKTERERATRVQDKGTRSVEFEKLEKKLEPARRAFKDSADKNQAAKRAYDAVKDKFAGFKKKYGAVEMVEQVAEEIEHIDELQQRLETDQQHQALLEKKELDLNGRIEKLQTEEARAKKLHAETEEAYQTLIRKHSAEDLRKHLQAGEPCPVCNQVVARVPKRVLTGKLDEAKKEAEDRRDAWNRKQRALDRAEADLAGLPNQLQSAKADVKHASKQISDLTKRAERILGKTPGGDAGAKLDRIATELRTAESECTSKEEESRKAAEGEGDAKEIFTRLERDRAVLTENIQSITQQIEDAAVEIQELRVRLKGVGDSKTIQAELKGQETAKVRRTEITKNIEQARKTRDQAQKQHNEVNARIAGLNGRIETLNRAVENAKSEAAQIERDLKKKLTGLVLPKGVDEAEQIDRYLTDLRTRCTDLTRQIEQKQARVDQLEIRIAEAEQKRTQVAELERSALPYAQLGNLLRADQFIEFVLEGAFDLLCNEGTRQLMTLTQGRYSFETEGNEFRVVDHWNADDRRSVRTLSGGESFLASLGLALALSSSVSQFNDGGGSFKLDALFLDEGFSTLDAETLNVAVEAIQALQEGDRMIAVISHVADLAERLPSRIQVIKGISGSEISLEQESAG
jgi:exonuclease SbcC